MTRALYSKLQKSSHCMKKELCLCLTEMNDVDPDEIVDKSDDWVKAVDRGGLKHISNTVYVLFVAIECVLQRHIDAALDKGLKEHVLSDESIQLYWSLISSNWEDAVGQDLLEMIADLWIKIRGHSTAKAWLEKYKLEKKKSVQKSKGIRKHLISSLNTKLT